MDHVFLGAFIHDQSSQEDSPIKGNGRQCWKKKCFLKPASRPFRKLFISYMSPDGTSQRVTTQCGDCEQTLSLDRAGEQGDSFSGARGKSKPHTVALPGAVSIPGPGHGSTLDTHILHDDETQVVGEKLGARGERARERRGGGGRSRQRPQERGNEAFLTPRTAWRQVIYKPNFNLTTKPWSIATLIDVSAA